MVTIGLCGVLLAGGAWKASQVISLVNLRPAGWSWSFSGAQAPNQARPGMSTVTKLGLGLGVCGLVVGGVAAWRLFFRKPQENSDAQAPRPRRGWSPEGRSPLPDRKWGNHITVLSIDGGGIRGRIPAVILIALEGHLQVSLPLIFN
jgi:hypothetical protein